MTGHQIATAFAKLAEVIDERDALRAELALISYQEYRRGYKNGYDARSRTEDRRAA